MDWYPWGEEAFTKARAEGKPLLVSVGYSACHWCHVMERESFEDIETADVMNELFVNVKVDREERPDVDDVYMTAVQAMNGHGGWPMTVFTTPDGKPFFAGTYFPKEDRGGMPSFRRVLHGVAEAWRERRSEITDQADRVAEAISHTIEPASNSIDAPTLEAAYRNLVSRVDREHGGFGGAPKFPQVPGLEFLLRVRREAWAGEADEILRLTLDRMAVGGIYDHLGGGFARYATDRGWLVPHFEKMLYDNALLARLYLWAGRELGNDQYTTVARQTLDYMLRDLLVPGGGLASAEDADSEGVEGKYYVFDHAAVVAAGAPHGQAVAALWGATEAGNFEGANILHAARTLAEVAHEYGLDPADLSAAQAAAAERLLEVRAGRIRPGLDDKVITAWNGLALRALAEAAAVLSDERYLHAARANAQFVLERLRRPDGRLLRSYRAGNAQVPAFLEDYAGLAVGVLTLYQVSGEAEWFDAGLELVDQMVDLFWDGAQFFATGRDAEGLITRPQDLMDNPAPAGNSLAAEALMMAALLTGRPDLFDLTEAALRAGGALAIDHPAAVGHLLAVAHSWGAPPKEVAVVGVDAGPLLAAVWDQYRPEVVVAHDPGTSSRAPVPLLEGRVPHQGPALAYVCERFVCQAPTNDPAQMRVQLGG